MTGTGSSTDGSSAGLPAAAGEQFTVAACGPAQRAEQAQLFNACFTKSIDAAGLTWRYDRNPHGSASSFVTRARGGQAVSGYACSPRRMLAGTDEHSLSPVGQTGDVMTHPDWRKRGLFSDLDRAAMADTAGRGWPLVFGLPNRRSAHIFLELGWESVGTVRPWCFVLRADAAARAMRHREGRLAGLLTPLAAARGRRARRRLGRAVERFSVTRLSRFPEQVEQLSRATEARHTAMVRRDAEYLNWRFIESPSGLHRVLGLHAGGELAAYVVIQVPAIPVPAIPVPGDRAAGSSAESAAGPSAETRSSSGASPRASSAGQAAGQAGGFVVDVLGRDDEACDAAVEAGLAELERVGASFVQATAIDGSSWNRTLERAGFQPPKPDNHLIVILHVHDPAHPLVAAARDPAGWYFTDGDRDDETMG